MFDELLKKLERGGISRRQFLKALGLAAGATVIGGPRFARAQEPIKIGVLGPEKIFVGAGIKNGATVAVEEINDSGGVLGRELVMDFRDTTGPPAGESPELALTNAVDLVDGGAKALIGHFRSEAVLAVLPEIPGLKVPLLITAATEFEHTAKVAADYNNYKYVFRPMLQGKFLAVNLVEFVGEYMAKHLVAKRLLRNNKVAIVAENLAWTPPIVGFLQLQLPQFGLDLVDTFMPNVGTPTFAPILSDIAANDVAATITIFSDTSMVPFTVEWARGEIPTGLFGINAMFQDPQAFAATGGASAYIVEMELYGGVAITRKTLPYFNKYIAKFGGEPVYSSYVTTDAVHLLAEAIERAGTPASDSVVPELEKTDYEGVSGQVQFYGLQEAAVHPFAEPHDSRYGFDFIYPAHVQIREERGKEKKGVIWPWLRANVSYRQPPWIR